MLCNFEFLLRTSIEGSNGNLIGPEDKDVFRNLVLICVCVGTLASIIFHMMIRIPKHINVSHVQSGFSTLNINQFKGLQLYRKPDSIIPYFHF